MFRPSNVAFRWLAAGVMGGFVAQGVASAQTSLSVEVETALRAPLQLGYPVPMTITIKNESETEVEVPRPACAGTPGALTTLEIGVRRFGESSFETIPYPSPSFLPYEIVPTAQQVSLGKGQTLKVSVDLTARWRLGGGSGDLVFAAPGDYQVQVWYANVITKGLDGGLEVDRGARLASNIVDVEIGAIAGNRDEQAWAALRGMKHWWLVYAPDVYSLAPALYEPDAGRIKVFASEHRSSRYGQLASLFVSYHDFREALGRDDADGMQRALNATGELAQDEGFGLSGKAAELSRQMKESVQALETRAERSQQDQPRVEPDASRGRAVSRRDRAAIDALVQRFAAALSSVKTGDGACAGLLTADFRAYGSLDKSQFLEQIKREHHTEVGDGELRVDMRVQRVMSTPDGVRVTVHSETTLDNRRLADPKVRVLTVRPADSGWLISGLAKE